jgi:DnaJ family protein C protein 11
LIIISAHYGLASAFTDRGLRDKDEEEVVVDVTTPVQALVMESKLYIPGGRAKVSGPLNPASDG